MRSAATGLIATFVISIQANHKLRKTNKMIIQNLIEFIEDLLYTFLRYKTKLPFSHRHHWTSFVILCLETTKYINKSIK